MASSLFKNYKMDQSKEVSGVVVAFAPNDDNTVPKFTISRMSRSNVRYTKQLEAESRPYRRQIELGTLDAMLDRELSMRVFVKAVLLGWEHVQDESGKELAFNEDNAMKLFKELPDLYDELQTQASKASLFRSEQQEAEAKN